MGHLLFQVVQVYFELLLDSNVISDFSLGLLDCRLECLVIFFVDVPASVYLYMCRALLMLPSLLISVVIMNYMSPANSLSLCLFYC
jgi:hypothetical protein